MNKYQHHFYPEIRFGGFSNIDGTISFYARINSLLKKTDVVLDIGCGRGDYLHDPVGFRRDLRILKNKVAKVIGIDIDESAQTNPLVDEFRLIANSRWPIDDASIDLAVGDFVLEHISDVDSFFSEVARVLRPNGYLCLRTCNKMSYFGLCVSLIPSRFHAKITQHVQDAREEEDVFPTVYRCNTRGKIRRAMRLYGFDAAVCPYEAEPAYLNFSKLAYRLGVLHQRLAPMWAKPNLFVFGTKKRAA